MDSYTIPQIEEHRVRICTIAQAIVVGPLLAKISPQDLVQETMVSAYSGFASLRQPASAESIQAWLITILRSKWLDTQRHYFAAKRDIRLEQSLVAEFDQSVAGIEVWLASNQTSPSMAVSRSEQLGRLAEALRQLPDEQREVVVQKHINNRTVPEIAQFLDKTPQSVTGLLRRGLAKLRELME